MPLLPIPSRAGSVSARALRAGLIALSALCLVTCTDNPTGLARTGRLLVRPVFDGSALFAPISVDSIHLTVIRPPSEVLKTIDRAFPANSDTVRVTAADIDLKSTSEDLLVTIELYAGGTLLFSGQQTVTVTAGVTSPPPAPVPMVYQGPGSHIASLTLTPRDTTVTLGAVFPFQVTATDSQQPNLTSFYVGWNASAGTIDHTGQFTAPPTRDTIVITVSAPAPNTTKDSTRVFVIALPGSFTITGGNGQSAVVGTRLPQPLTVRVNGTDNLPLPGVIVNFAATTGGGSVDNATVTTDAQGIAQTDAILGATVGPQTFTASAQGIPDALFTETATAIVGGIVWDGSASNSWTDQNNWTPAVVPGLADDVTIPSGTPNQPLVLTTANMNNLTIAGGATLSLGGTFTFNIAGNLDASGSLVVTTGSPTVQLSGTSKTLRGTVANVTVTGTVGLAGPTTVSGNASISGGTASLDIGINALQVGGNFSTGSGGRLSMVTGGGSVTIAGSATFGGGDETGLLTAGAILIGGNFTQTGGGSANSFVASGSHLTAFTGATATHTVSFVNPATGAGGSHFNTLDISGTGTVSLASDAFADLQLLSTPSGTPPTLGATGATHRLTAFGASVTGLTVNQATLSIGNGSIVAFNNVHFTNSPVTGTQLTVSHSGLGGPFTFSGLTFATTPTTGFYLSATDVDGATNGVLTITMSGATPAIGAPFVQQNGGAVVNWSAAGGRTWTGNTSTNWSVASNWNPQVVPTTADDVVIPPTTNQPTVTASCAAKSLTVNTGATLNLGTINCQVLGDVVSDGAITGTGALALSVTSQIRGNLPSLIVSGPVTASGTVTATGNLTVTGTTGNFIVGGQAVGIGGNLQTQSSALLTMTNALDVLSVNGNASFGGGNELGLMSAGLLVIGGNFTQIGSGSGDSFHPSGTHLTTLSGASPTINFGTPGDVPGTSHFQEVSWSGNGTLTLATPAFAHGTFTTASATPITVTSAAGVALQVGNYTSVGATTFNNTRLVINTTAPLPLALHNLTFQAMPTTSAQLTVNHTGAGGPFTFTSLTFSTLPVAPNGFYLSAADLDGATNGGLTINMVAPTPTTPGAFLSAPTATVVWPAAAGRTWGGTISTDWFTAGNWVGGTAPTATDDAVIPAGTPNQPSIGSSTTIHSLTVQPGAVLSLGDISLNVNGNLDASGLVSGCCGDFIAMSGGTLKGNFSDVVVSVSPGAVVTLNGLTTLTSSTVQVEGELILNGNTLSLGQGTLSTLNGTGRLTMTNPADHVIAGFTDFSGGDETGKLTAGILQTQSFSQGGTVSTSFLAGGSHMVVLGGPSTSTVAFSNPATSRFQELNISGVSATLTLGSNVTVAGQLISLPSANGPTVNGAGFTLTAGGADVTAFAGSTAITFDGVPLVLSGGTITAFSRVTFQNQNPDGVALTVNNVGQATPFTFGNLVFTTQLDTGLHILALDLDGPTSGVLTIYIIGATPAASGAHQGNNGAIILWPPTGNTFTWTGGTNSDWSNPGNWDRNAVPSPIDDVVLVPITNQPSLSQPVSVNKVTSTSGSILDLKGSVLVANGDVDLAGSIVDGVGGGGVTLTGVGKAVRGTINAEVAVQGSYTLSGNFIISGNMSVPGSLNISAFTAQVGGSFITIGGGVLVMQDPGGLLDIAGDAIFNGGNTDGLLKSGRIDIAGTFAQIGTSDKKSFAADPGHLTRMSANPASITFTDPGPTLSHFGDFAETGFGATFNLNSDVTVLGGVNGGDGFGGTMIGASCPTTLTTTGWNTSGSPTLDCVRLVINDPSATTSGMGGVSFINLPTSTTQLTIRHPGFAAGNFFTNFLVFVPLTTGDTGFYIQVEDTDGIAPTLTVQPSGTNVTNGPSFTNSVGGGTVLWP